ncbi:DUF308 domain-containing protein [Bombilactobacillus thymidiniphilus]|uniref:DUF308 domain-containing protein n=1 Tax=Bombilactobacillus thymidiniphilus TaxID=2923363 RepID=A0ABY4PC53_9LACO|nr:DUF308 domain-containing protein [Bombilactobacillus thymidiniphilus]UQS83122.1 DUF308 domain-containing protein [Bombilactobacillus thymidiniphilus]
MNQYSRKFHWYRWLRIVFLFLAGLLIVLNPNKSLNGILYLIAAYLVFLGIIALRDGWLLAKNNSDNNSPFATATISFILAILIFPVAHILLPLLPLILGIILLINGVNQFFNARVNRKYVNITPWPDYIYSLLLIIVGVVLIFNPFGMLQLFFRILGIGLMILAILEFINTRLYH